MDFEEVVGFEMKKDERTDGAPALTSAKASFVRMSRVIRRCLQVVGSLPFLKLARRGKR